MPVEEIVTQLRTLWKFDYEPKIKALRELYEIAKKEQWNAASDIPWNLEIDPSGDILEVPRGGRRQGMPPPDGALRRCGDQRRRSGP